ncbi:MAG: transcriptional regulator [Bacillaceae bacterium]|nr:transcriptional regulator [Bacillaceae bacterium]
MTERVIRLLRIINLVQAFPGIKARELAEKCEAAERTIYRDLELLSAAGIPITTLGHGKGYGFTGDFSMYPLDWNEQEAIAFSMLPSIFDQIETMLPSGFDSAYEKVMATYRREKKKQADLLQNVTDLIQMGTPAHRENRSHYLLEIVRATLEQKTIDTVYHTQSRNAESRRRIDPYNLVPREHRFYLIGYCHKAKEVRTFRISRFRRVDILEETFDKRDFNIKKYLRNTWSIERGEKEIHFKIRFHPDVARYVKEEEMFVKPKMTDLEDGGLLFEVTLNHDREFLNWLSQYGPDAEILEPESYREDMKKRLEKWMKLYQ